MTRSPHSPRTERGAAALLVASLTLVLVGILAFVTDYGMAYANQRRLQNGVDAAVLAVGQKVATSASASRSCDQTLALLDQAELRRFALTFLQQNAPGDGVDLEPGDPGFSVTCEALGETGAEQLVVSASGAQASPTFFGGVLGADGISLREGARAVVGVGIPLGLRPFGICAEDAETLMSSTGAHTLVYSRSQQTGPPNGQTDPAGCGESGVSGHWGLLDFGMGVDHGLGSGTGCTGTVDDGIKCWVKEGFNGTLDTPTAVPGKTGVLTQVKAEMDAILGTELPIPVYSSVVPGNPQDQYVVSGFVYVKVCAFDFGGGSEGTAGCVEEPQWSQRELLGQTDGQAARAAWSASTPAAVSAGTRAEPAVAVRAAASPKTENWWDQVDLSAVSQWIRDLLCRFIGICAPTPAPTPEPGPPADGGDGSQPASYLQLRFVRHITAGTMDFDCEFGSDCDFGIRIVKLAE